MDGKYLYFTADYPYSVTTVNKSVKLNVVYVAIIQGVLIEIRLV